MKNGKLLASFHMVWNVDTQKDQECWSMYHITENGLMIILKNVGLTTLDTSFHIYLMPNTPSNIFENKMDKILSSVYLQAFSADYFFYLTIQTNLAMDFDRILSYIGFITLWAF